MKKLFTSALFVATFLFSARALAAQDGPDPGENPNPELLKDEFLYNFTGNTPTDWMVEGKAEQLTARDTYNSATGSAVRITAIGTEGSLSQTIDMPSTQGAAGDVFEGLLHYLVDEGPETGAVRLSMQWLNVRGEVITSQDDKLFVDNSALWFSMPKTWGTLRFRTTMPMGATRFRFSIRVNLFSKVRLDDFSFRKQTPPLTPFISVLPQSQPAHYLHLGQSATHRYYVQSSGLTGSRNIEITSGVPFRSNLTSISGSGTQELIVTCTPTTAGKIPRGKAVSALTIPVDETRTVSIPLRVYSIDPAKPPRMSIDPASFGVLTYEQGAPAAVSKDLNLRFENMIDDVTIAVTPMGKGFSINKSSVMYFEKAYPGLKIGVNDTPIKVSFRNPNANVGEVDAVLTLTSPMAETLSYPIKVQVTAAGSGWIEKFTKKRTATGSRYTDIADRGYGIYDKGVWRAEGGALIDADERQVTFLNGGSTLYFEGTFRNGGIYNEDFLSGIASITVQAGDVLDAAAELAVEVSYDHGGTWMRPAAAQRVVANRKLTYALNTHQPTIFRLVRTNDGSYDQAFMIRTIEVTSSADGGRVVLPSLAEVLSFSGMTSRSQVRELFQGKLHHGALRLEGWRNYSFSGNRPWVAFTQLADDSGTGEPEEVAKITLYNSTRQSEAPLTAHLVSPLLSYTNAPSKELTFRLFKQVETPGDLFFVYLAPVENGQVKEFMRIPFESITPNGEVKERTWYDYLINLADIPELGTSLQDFVVVFSLQSQVDGNGTSTTYLLDDFTWGQTNNPVLSLDRVDVPFVSQVAGRRSEPKKIVVSTRNGRDVVRTMLYSTNSKVFAYEPAQLLPEGGEISITAKPERDVDYAGQLYLMTRGGATIYARLFCTPKPEVTSATELDVPNAFAYRRGTLVVVNAPGLKLVEAYALDGVRIARASSWVGQEMQLEVPLAVEHPVLVLHYEDGHRQTIKL